MEAAAAARGSGSGDQIRRPRGRIYAERRRLPGVAGAAISRGCVGEVAGAGARCCSRRRGRTGAWGPRECERLLRPPAQARAARKRASGWRRRARRRAGARGRAWARVSAGEPEKTRAWAPLAAREAPRRLVAEGAKEPASFDVTTNKVPCRRCWSSPLCGGGLGDSAPRGALLGGGHPPRSSQECQG
ncbi:hypothetical protein C2845_PM02G32350 [Panicum miliaceum]|uniref:Uncharacterized protein n=1 Tax=Panicum miliaceum TaxID=4540 RepID=A0A3L6SD16_PANMI|nr:hypothetical protein C2845_PM02G32350 [Panicum miliaceum]